MGGNVIEIRSSSEFQKQVNATKPALVDFTASWCGPCKAMAPYFEKLSNKYESKITFLKVDVDQNQEIASEHGVRAMPTFLLFVKGKITEQVVGANPNNLEDICHRWSQHVATFSGASRKLTDAMPAESAPQTESQQPASDSSALDESQPVTTLQIRTADGVRHVSKFNTSTTIADLRRFISAKHPKGPATFQLMSGVPPKYISADDAATLEEADLIDAVVIQRP